LTERFYRGTSVLAKSPALVCAIVRSQSPPGAARVQSNLGRGSTFSVIFPDTRRLPAKGLAAAVQEPAISARGFSPVTRTTAVASSDESRRQRTGAVTLPGSEHRVGKMRIIGKARNDVPVQVRHHVAETGQVDLSGASSSRSTRSTTKHGLHQPLALGFGEVGSSLSCGRSRSPGNRRDIGIADQHTWQNRRPRGPLRRPARTARSCCEGD